MVLQALHIEKFAYTISRIDISEISASTADAGDTSGNFPDHMLLLPDIHSAGRSGSGGKLGVLFNTHIDVVPPHFKSELKLI
jgi:hypothetical protein